MASNEDLIKTISSRQEELFVRITTILKQDFDLIGELSKNELHRAISYHVSFPFYEDKVNLRTDREKEAVEILNEILNIKNELFLSEISKQELEKETNNKGEK